MNTPYSWAADGADREGGVRGELEEVSVGCPCVSLLCLLLCFCGQEKIFDLF